MFWGRPGERHGETPACCCWLGLIPFWEMLGEWTGDWYLPGIVEYTHKLHKCCEWGFVCSECCE